MGKCFIVLLRAINVGGRTLIMADRGGVGESKLSPAVLDRAADSAVTARNWSMVRKLIAMAAE